MKETTEERRAKMVDLVNKLLKQERSICVDLCRKKGLEWKQKHPDIGGVATHATAFDAGIQAGLILGIEAIQSRNRKKYK